MPERTAPAHEYDDDRYPPTIWSKAAGGLVNAAGLAAVAASIAAGFTVFTASPVADTVLDWALGSAVALVVLFGGALFGEFRADQAFDRERGRDDDVAHGGRPVQDTNSPERTTAP